ncbi:MAG TPA: hypothetical protein VIT92_09880 [Burkholderiaceae bacterium]
MIRYVIAALMLYALTACAWCEPGHLPAPFAQAIPAALPDGLKLVEIRGRGKAAPPWRIVKFFDEEGKRLLKAEEVSVAAGYTAMYAYPDTEYFANVKVERSVPGKFAHDRLVSIEALEYSNRNSQRYVAGHPELFEKYVQAARAAGQAYIQLEKGSRDGIEYVVATRLQIEGGVVSQVVMLDASRELIVTAYLLAQKKQRARTVQDFVSAQRSFIDSYVAVLAAR